jgi:hypothetical protein
MTTTPVPLPPTSQSVTLNASGNGTVQLGPYYTHERWQLTSVSVSASTNVKEAQCKIYVGSNVSQGNYVDGTLSGSTGDSTGRLAGYVVGHGVYLWAVWSGGDVGAVATMQVQGTRTTG